MTNAFVGPLREEGEVSGEDLNDVDEDLTTTSVDELVEANLTFDLNK